MNPIEFERRLDEAITARDADELRRLQSLASRDGDCHAVWVEYEAFRHAISCWIASVPEVDLTEGVLARMEALDGAADESFAEAAGPHVGVAVNGHQRSTAGRVRRMAISLAIVASVLCLIVPSLWRMRGDRPLNPAERPGVQADVVERSRPSGEFPSGLAEHLAVDAVAPSGDELFSQASRVPSSLARRAANSVSGALVLVPDMVELDRPADDAGESDSMLGRLGRNLEPIGRDVSKSLGFLWDTLPTQSAPST